MLHHVPVVVVELIPVPVPLVDLLFSIALGHFRAGDNFAGVAAQAQGAALVDVRVLVGHKVDDLVQAVLVELPGVGVRNAADVPAELDDRHLHSQADAQIGDVLFPGKARRQNHALNAPASKAPGNDDSVAVPQPGGHVLLVQGLRVHPVDVHLGAVVIARVAQGLHHGEIGVVELHILAHQSDAHVPLAAADPLHHAQPLGHVRLGSGKIQLPAHDVRKVAFLQHNGGLVQHRDGQVLNDAVRPHVAEQGDFLKNAGVVDGHVRAQDDDVGLNAHALQLLHRVLGGLGLVFPGAVQVRHQGYVDKEGISRPHLLAYLADGLQKGLALNVARRAANLRNDNIRVGFAAHAVDKALDFTGNVGNDLDGLSQIFAPALLIQHVPVDLAGGQVGELIQVLVNKPLIVAQVQVRLQAVLRDVDLPVLVGAHGAWVHIDVGVQLLRRHL